MTKVRVDVTDEFLLGLVKNPRQGLVELIDNALDADATTIDGSFERTPLDAICGVVVTDDANGMTDLHAARAFGALGNSWKQASRVSTRGRRLRGRRGQGRWAAFSLGHRVEWRSVSAATAAGLTAVGDAGSRPGVPSAADGGSFELVTVTGSGGALGEFDIEGRSPVTGPPGTTVTIATCRARRRSSVGRGRSRR